MAVNFLRHSGTCYRKIFLETKFISLMSVRIAHKYSHADVTPSRYTTIYRNLHGAIDEPSTAKDFVYALNKNERELLQFELQKFNIDMKDIPGAGTHSRPSTSQLKAVALHNALPFIGFGFLDNFLMILAGEYIEFRFGAMFGISTMAAAALGNWISDLAGVQTAHYVEVVASKFGVKAPALSPEQVDMSATKWSSNIGKAIGISIGCFLGMIPLIFYEPRKTESKEKENQPS